MKMYFITKKSSDGTNKFNTIIGVFNNRANAMNHLQKISTDYLNQTTSHTIKYDSDLKCFYYTNPDISQPGIKAPYSITAKPLNQIFKASKLIVK